jgi:signal peptide peptidase SppA
MKLLDVLTAPWAIEPAKLLEIQAIYATHLRGDKIDIAAIEAKLGRPLDNSQQSYQIQDGVAILPVEGVIAKRANLFSQISGGASTDLLARDFKSALQDPAVHSIILAIDSPGGTVDGTITLAQLVAASSKPVVALASGTMASAAYWIGSAANAVYITDATTIVGSIGVVATHTDVSQAQASAGIKTTEIAAGKYKRIASSYEPLSKEGRQTIQDQVDYTYALFVDAVAQHRGTSAKQVLAKMADGRIFIGQQALDAGLVDAITTQDALVSQLNAQRASGQPPARASQTHTRPAPTNPKDASMQTTRETIAADAPDVLAALQAEGASAERARIQAIEAQAIPGHEALIAALKYDGKSTAGDAAIAILAAEKQQRNAKAAALAADAPQALPLVPDASAPPTPKTRADIHQAAKAHMAANPGTDYIAAIKTVSTGA